MALKYNVFKLALLEFAKIASLFDADLARYCLRLVYASLKKKKIKQNKKKKRRVSDSLLVGGLQHIDVDGIINSIHLEMQ
jgi:hypothetical protein